MKAESEMIARLETVNTVAGFREIHNDACLFFGGPIQLGRNGQKWSVELNSAFDAARARIRANN